MKKADARWLKTYRKIIKPKMMRAYNDEAGGMKYKKCEFCGLEMTREEIQILEKNCYPCENREQQERMDTLKHPDNEGA